MKYQRCTRCVMDNASDRPITFDAQGHCNYCTEALEASKKVYFPNEEGQMRLEAMIKILKEEGKNKQYECVMRLSGGLDSSYLAMFGLQMGLAYSCCSH